MLSYLQMRFEREGMYAERRRWICRMGGMRMRRRRREKRRLRRERERRDGDDRALVVRLPTCRTRENGQPRLEETDERRTRRTGENDGEVVGIRRLRDEVVNGVLDAEAVVELASDDVESAVGVVGELVEFESSLLVRFLTALRHIGRDGPARRRRSASSARVPVRRDETDQFCRGSCLKTSRMVMRTLDRSRRTRRVSSLQRRKTPLTPLIPKPSTML